ncbi:MAG: cyclic nucleotide-binding domain-containing protein [Acidimicrobiales bacterium]|nr:cyclic nucleotide-binding domain-containing protein [Acidimicrobiales bacterium]
MPGKRVDTLDYLAKVPLFSACSKRDLDRISKASDQITVPAGQILVDQGDAGRDCYVVVEGTATVRRNGRKIATLGPGSVIGELSLLDHGPRTATVLADTDMVLLVIDQRHFAGLIDTVPALAHKLLAYLAARVRDFDRQAYG